MPKYLMFDHGGVLDNQRSYNPKPTDLILKRFDDGSVQVIPNGIQFVNDLNELVTQYGYEVIFHSKNKEYDQLDVLKKIQDACSAIGFPPVKALIARNEQEFPNIPSNNPRIIKNRASGIFVAGYSDDRGLYGKACVREAASQLLAIPKEERHQHIIFDDGAVITNMARVEGYQAYLIGEGSAAGSGQIALSEAIKQVLANERAKAHDRARGISEPPLAKRATQMQWALQGLTELVRQRELSEKEYALLQTAEGKKVYIDRLLAGDARLTVADATRLANMPTYERENPGSTWYVTLLRKINPELSYEEAKRQAQSPTYTETPPHTRDAYIRNLMATHPNMRRQDAERQADRPRRETASKEQMYVHYLQTQMHLSSDEAVRYARAPRYLNDARSNLQAARNAEIQAEKAWRELTKTVQGQAVSSDNSEKLQKEAQEIAKTVTEQNAVAEHSKNPESNKKYQDFIQFLIDRLSGKVDSGRLTHDTRDSGGKIDMLEDIKQWFDTPHDERSKEIAMAMVRDTCGIKRYSFTWWTPHSLDEFISLSSEDEYKSLKVADISFSAKTLKERFKNKEEGWVEELVQMAKASDFSIGNKI